jgi:hypothetical protein
LDDDARVVRCVSSKVFPDEHPDALPQAASTGADAMSARQLPEAQNCKIAVAVGHALIIGVGDVE